MDERGGFRGNASGLKAFSLLFLGLVLASLLPVHAGSYEPAVSFVLLYLVVCAGVTAAVALVLSPAAQFSDGFGAGAYALYAAVVAMMVSFPAPPGPGAARIPGHGAHDASGRAVLLRPGRVAGPPER